MKNKFFKNFLYFCAAIVLIFVIIFSLKIIYEASAKRNFETGKYDVAVKQYSLLLKMKQYNFFKDSNDVKYETALANSLIKLPFNYKNQSLICDFIEKYEGKPFTYSLDQKLKKFKSDLDVMIGPNYIDKAPLNNQILRWEDDAFPLKVYIYGGDGIYQDAAKRAFDYWTYTSKNFFSFAYTNNKKEANVTVEITGSAKSNCEGDGCLYVAAMTVPDIKHGILKSMDMLVYTKDPYGRVTSPDDVYKVVLHEIGHVLGIMGHSDKTENLMYASGKHIEFEYTEQHKSALSMQDINTLNYLYMIVPNISNIPQNKHNTVNKIHPSVILGTSRQINERDIENAKKYIATAPYLAIGYMDLGNAYVQAKRYEEGLKTYQQGFKLATDNQDKYNFVWHIYLFLHKINSHHF